MTKLPVWDTVKNAVGYTLSNIGLLAKASMIWIALYTILVGVFGFLGGEVYYDALSTIMNSSKTGGEDQLAVFAKLTEAMDALGTSGYIVYVLMILVSFFAYYSIAISWHRACLLDELPPMVRFGKLELKYFGYSILLTFVLAIVALIPIAIIFVMGQSGDSPGYTFLILLALFISFPLILGRLSLVFPGVAVRDRRMSFRTSWEATKGNSWRILGGNVLCGLTMMLVSVLSGLIGSMSLPLIIIMPVLMALQLFAGAFMLSYMSICYQVLVPPPSEGDLA